MGSGGFRAMGSRKGIAGPAQPNMVAASLVSVPIRWLFIGAIARAPRHEKRASFESPAAPRPAPRATTGRLLALGTPSGPKHPCSREPEGSPPERLEERVGENEHGDPPDPAQAAPRSKPPPGGQVPSESTSCERRGRHRWRDGSPFGSETEPREVDSRTLSSPPQPVGAVRCAHPPPTMEPVTEEHGELAPSLGRPRLERAAEPAVPSASMTRALPPGPEEREGLESRSPNKESPRARAGVAARPPRHLRRGDGRRGPDTYRWIHRSTRSPSPTTAPPPATRWSFHPRA